jgi:hypothetical protein
MLKNILKKYWIFIFIFIFFHAYSFVLGLNDESLLPYLNFIIYFLTFILIRETISKTALNKNIVYLFYLLFGYLSIVLPLSILFRPSEFWMWVCYTYTHIALPLFIFIISIYLTLFSYQKWLNNNYKLLFACLLGCLVIGLNYSEFILDPLALSQEVNWSSFAVSNYSTMAISIIALLIFWIRYYQKYFVVSEYLNLVIFLFTLSNLAEALHFVSLQHEFKIFIDGQAISLILNTTMFIVWYMRLSYLYKEISLQNERFLKNFQFLNGLVSKPKKSFLNNLYISSAIPILFGSITVIILLILALYFINQITFYLFENTVFILIAVIFAIYYSLRSIKRDWHNQIGFLFMKKIKKSI